MLALSDYLGALVNEVSKARVAIDQVSAGIAEDYSKNEHFKNVPAPRFRIPEITLSIPAAISKVNYEKVTRFDFSNSKYQDFLKMEIATFFDSYPSFRNRTRKIEIRNGKKSKRMFQKIMDTDKRSKPNLRFDNMKSTIDADLDEVIDEILEENQLVADSKRLDPNRKMHAQLKTKMGKLVKEAYQIKLDKLKDVQINPETAILQNIGNENKLLRINMKIVEEGVFMHTETREDGTKYKRLDLD